MICTRHLKIRSLGGFFINVNLSFEFGFSNDLTPSPAKFSQCGTIRPCTPRTGLDPELIKGNFGSNRARTKPFIFTTYFRISAAAPRAAHTHCDFSSRPRKMICRLVRFLFTNYALSGSFSFAHEQIGAHGLVLIAAVG